MHILLATHNGWKTQLFTPVFRAYGFEVLTLVDLPDEELPPSENGTTALENASVSIRPISPGSPITAVRIGPPNDLIRQQVEIRAEWGAVADTGSVIEGSSECVTDPFAPIFSDIMINLLQRRIYYVRPS